MKWHHTAENRKKKSRQNNKTLSLLAARFKGAPEAAGWAGFCSFSWNHWWDKVTFPPFMIVSEQSRDKSRRARMPLPTGHFSIDHCQVQTLPTRQSTQQIPALAEAGTQRAKGLFGSISSWLPHQRVQKHGREKISAALGSESSPFLWLLGQAVGEKDLCFALEIGYWAE